MDKLHITHKQWLCFLKWTIYTLMFVVTLTIQNTILSRVPIFGVKLDLIPPCLICVALIEGGEQGGVFALCTSLVWALSGSDFGFVSILVLTAGAIFSAWLCTVLLRRGLLSCALCCLAALLIHESCIFLMRLYLGTVTPIQYLLVLLPGVLFSLIGCPVFYYLSRAISKIGG